MANGPDENRKSPSKIDSDLEKPPTDQSSIEKPANIKFERIPLKIAADEYAVVEYTQFFGFLLEQCSSLSEKLEKTRALTIYQQLHAKEPTPAGVDLLQQVWISPDKSTMANGPDENRKSPSKIDSGLEKPPTDQLSIEKPANIKPAASAPEPDASQFIEKCLQLLKDQDFLPKKDRLAYSVFKESLGHLLARIYFLAEKIEDSLNVIAQDKRVFSQSVSAPPKSDKSAEAGSHSSNRSLSGISIASNNVISSEIGSVGPKMGYDAFEDDPHVVNEQVFEFRDNEGEENDD